MNEARFRPGHEDGFDIEDDEEDDLLPTLHPVGAVCLLQGLHGQGVHAVAREFVRATVNLTSSRLGR